MLEDHLASLEELFGPEVRDRDWRESSYELLESYVTQATATDGSVVTDHTLGAFRKDLTSLSDQHLAFLLAHSGFIPDHYGADSSQETLHTKLTEALVAEWGKRQGFDTELQKEKASKEDVTFRHNSRVIVCDTKSYRLGRSQAAPNVKDTIKQGDYRKWLRAYPSGHRAGGLVTFPSKHDWKRASDVYAYASNHKDPILLLFYEHLAYLAIHAGDIKGTGSIYTILDDYSNLFAGGPKKARDDYWSMVDPAVSSLAPSNNFNAILPLLQLVTEEAVLWAFGRIEARLTSTYEKIRLEVRQLHDSVVREKLVTEMGERATYDLKRYEENIRRFRL